VLMSCFCGNLARQRYRDSVISDCGHLAVTEAKTRRDSHSIHSTLIMSLTAQLAHTKVYNQVTIAFESILHPTINHFITYFTTL
jgi:hypothetical protein